jgi:hypothetical protein
MNHKTYMIELYNRLLEDLDKKYFGDIPLCTSVEEVVYMLAGWCYDNGIEFNEDGWKLLDEIYLRFGSSIRLAVLHHLFHRNHDT